jgi:hypothetical protein
MPKYVIAYHSPKGPLTQEIVEMDSRESALRFFFMNYCSNEAYTQDEEGYVYFKEDFEDPLSPIGNILEI